MNKIKPMISEQIMDIILVESLIALDEFETKGDREAFQRWQTKWERELSIIETITDIKFKEMEHEINKI